MVYTLPKKCATRDQNRKSHFFFFFDHEKARVFFTRLEVFRTFLYFIYINIQVFVIFVTN